MEVPPLEVTNGTVVPLLNAIFLLFFIALESIEDDYAINSKRISSFFYRTLTLSLGVVAVNSQRGAVVFVRFMHRR